MKDVKAIGKEFRAQREIPRSACIFQMYVKAVEAIGDEIPGCPQLNIDRERKEAQC